MGDISVMYRQEALGKEVWIKFPVEGATTYQFFKGLVTKMEAYFPDHDATKPLEYQHFVYFGDSDDGYYNLTEQEDSGYLKWTNPAEGEEKSSSAGAPAAASASTTAAVASTGSTTARPVTPEKPTRKRQAERTSPAVSPKKIRVKMEFGSVKSNIEDPTNNEINPAEFAHWLGKIHTGKRGNPLSESNFRSVMNRVRDLASGDGISYKNWPASVRFHKDQPFNLSVDFHTMLLEAKSYEKRYGRDLGNGWLLSHPIKKVALFKDYVEAKRQERANPELIS